ncbi:MAG: cytochrome c1 [Gammaproteobacteria bacterium]|nr:cytochrome c1 [Gammaproteobacteria bacterium]MBU1968455.1 cytochrome c1 [Gammaproteobacteria bacterium]
MNAINKLWMLVLLLAVPMLASASDAGLHLDKAPGDLGDKASLQRGAKFFTSNCLACHSAAYMRYNRLADIGMSLEEIKAMLPEGAKPGSTMSAAMDAASAKMAFGVAPPDLSVVSRVRGTDWLYTYFRSFYVDSKSASGVNNLVFPSVAMPNVLGYMQGDQELDHATGKLKLVTPGAMSTAEFDATIADLVNYLDFMGEPAKLVRYKLGYIVIGFLFLLLILSYALKKEFWKDVH